MQQTAYTAHILLLLSNLHCRTVHDLQREGLVRRSQLAPRATQPGCLLRVLKALCPPPLPPPPPALILPSQMLPQRCGALEWRHWKLPFEEQKQCWTRCGRSWSALQRI